jgi:hypothetical protein
MACWLLGPAALWAFGVQAQTTAPPAASPPAATPAMAASVDETRLQVTAPYLEMRSGPGRGYPVFYVVERAQWVNVELRRTDWYRVRAERGQTGWVQRDELASTLIEGAGTQNFGDALQQDFWHRRVELGGAAGRFKSDPAQKLWLNFKIIDAVGAELTLGQVQGVFSGSDFWHLSLVAEPWRHWVVSPFISLGGGQINNVPNASQVNASRASGNLTQGTLGVRWHINQRFTARLDATQYRTSLKSANNGDNNGASTAGKASYRSVTLGVGFFF